MKRILSILGTIAIALPSVMTPMSCNLFSRKTLNHDITKWDFVKIVEKDTDLM